MDFVCVCERTHTHIWKIDVCYRCIGVTAGSSSIYMLASALGVCFFAHLAYRLLRCLLAYTSFWGGEKGFCGVKNFQWIRANQLQ